MENHIVQFIPMIFLGFLFYTLLLAVARRIAQQRGAEVVATFLSVLWWLTIDIGLILLALFFTSSTYRNWFPPELLSDSTLLGGFFQESELTLADLMGLILTLIIFMLAHGAVHASMLFWQQLSENGFSSQLENGSYQIDFIKLTRSILGLCILCGGIFLILCYWEGPILALRSGELLGSKTVEKSLDDIVRVTSVREFLGDSWLLNALVYIWTFFILFISWGFIRAFHLMLHVMQQTSDTAPNAEGNVHTEADQQLQQRIREIEERAADIEKNAARTEDTARVIDVRPITTPTQVQDKPTEIGARAAAEAPGTQAAAAAVLTPERFSQNGHYHSEPTQHTDVQELIDQIEDEREQRMRAERERDALALEQARNPLWQPNRIDPDKEKGDFNV